MPDPTPTETADPTLADDHDPDRDEQGRIGYGRWGKWSPVGLALLIVATVVVIYLVDRGSEEEIDGPPSSTTTGELMEPRPAPAFALTPMDGGDPVTLESLAGNVVVVNFWASWCSPCREEMPALQASWEAHQDDGVVFVGVGAKNDKQDEAEAFAEEYGITYPIGRDTEGGDALAGEIEKGFGVPGYPATFFITPDGMINQIVFGPLETEDLDTYIANARD